MIRLPACRCACCGIHMPAKIELECMLNTSRDTAFYTELYLAIRQGEEGGYPHKRFYRARAHSNPLNDAHFPVPTSPADVDWWAPVMRAFDC